eukprot:3683956-Rhodomonas_salina.2
MHRVIPVVSRTVAPYATSVPDRAGVQTWSRWSLARVIFSSVISPSYSCSSSATWPQHTTSAPNQRQKQHAFCPHAHRSNASGAGLAESRQGEVE